MKTAAKIGIGTLVAAGLLSFPVYEAFFRDYDHLLEPELQELRAMGVPVTWEERRAQNEGLPTLTALETEVVAIRSHPSYLDFMMASKRQDPSQPIGMVDPDKAWRLLKTFEPELEAIRREVYSSDKGFDLPVSRLPSPTNTRLRDLYSILARKLALETEKGAHLGAVETGFLMLKLSERLAKTDPYGSWATPIQSSAYSGLRHLLRDIHETPSALELLEEGTRSVPRMKIWRRDAANLPILRDRYRHANPFRGMVEAFPDQAKMSLSTARSLAESHRKVLQTEIARFRALDEAGDDLQKLNHLVETDPALKSQRASLRRDIADARQERLPWALLRAGVLILLHRQRTGSLPAKLEEVAGVPPDPMTNTPFVYKQVDDGFIVYSPGLDGDQGGLAQPNDPWQPRDVVVEVRGLGG